MIKSAVVVIVIWNVTSLGAVFVGSDGGFMDVVLKGVVSSSVPMEV